MKSYKSNIPLLIFLIIIQHVLCEDSLGFNCVARNQSEEYQHTFEYASLSENDISIDDEESQEKIVLRLCSPISQKCAGRDGYSICLTKNGEETGIGKFPPQVNLQSGAQSFVFTGDPCERDKNYTIIIMMKCDYSATGSTKPVKFPESENKCLKHMIWHTSKACIEPTETNCTVVDKFNNTYDLSSLTSKSDNHVAYIGDNNTNPKMILNVCHSIIYGHEATCPHTSGACFENLSNTTKIEYDNYGDVSAPLSIENGILKIVYKNGILCTSSSHLQTHQTSIIFICDPEATENTEPKFMKESEPCDMKFSWRTALACNQTYLRDYRMINDSKCTVIDPNTKFNYNLRTLMGKNFVSNAVDGTQYKFRICGSIPDAGCTQGTGICKTNDSTSAGIANGNLMSRHGGPYLNYTDGATCGRSGQKRYTIIAFVCGAEGLPDSPVVVKDEPCYLTIHFRTNLACKNGTVCATAKNEINLLPLIRTTENYVVKTTTDDEFYINVCRPIVPTINLACPQGSSACKVTKSSKDRYTKEISLGFPDESPIRNDNDNNVILNYTQGSPCPEYPDKNISSSLEFLCDYNGDMGKPELKNYSNCHYVFEWRTNIVCSAVVGIMDSPCTIKDPSHSRELDLSLLYQKPVVPRLVRSKEKNYSISICGGEKHCNGSVVCQGTNGYGTFSTVTFDYRNSVIKLQYLNGSKCLTKSYASEISLICNSTAGIGEPVRVGEFGDSDANCSALFEWHTNVACANSISGSSITTEKTILTDPANIYTATRTWVVSGMLIVVIMVIGIWLYLRDPRRCANLRSRIGAITAARNHSCVQYSRVNTTEEARLLLDTTDTCTDEQIDSDEELLGV